MPVTLFQIISLTFAFRKVRINKFINITNDDSEKNESRIMNEILPLSW